MTGRLYSRVVAGIGVALVVGVAAAYLRGPAPRGEIRQVPRAPALRPDYTDLLLPPNIAPLNFSLVEPGTAFQVRITGTAGGAPILIRSRRPQIAIPLRPWRALLSANQGGALRYGIHARGPDGVWRQFAPFTNAVATDEIDSHLAHRLIRPLYNYWRDVGVYQRDVTSFRSAKIAHGSDFGRSCVNCHSFCNNSPRQMTLGIRGAVYGSSALLAQSGHVRKLGTKFGYTAWHPSGRIIAYSANKVRQFFHSAGIEVRDVVDLESAIAYYVLDSQESRTAPQLSDPDRLQTYPTWSADGRDLYFCSAPVLWTDRNAMPPKRYREVRYDLKRVAYDLAADRWGEVETVLSAEEAGGSVLLPRVSPDGRHLLFCVCDYGCFPIYQPSSDLYLMDLPSRKYRRLRINSDRSESWHSWSSNSRWIAFSSKRRDGLLTRTYFAHVNEQGDVSKPFILPQRDPTFYDSFLKTFSVPELITGPVLTQPTDMAAAVRSPRQIPVTSPVKFATPSGTTPWRPAPRHSPPPTSDPTADR